MSTTIPTSRRKSPVVPVASIATTRAACPKGRWSSAAGILTGIGLVLGWMDAQPAWLGNIAFAAATLAGGLLVFPAAWKALMKLRLDMNVLMTVAVAGAWILGESAEAASVVFLFSLSELLESWAAKRARNAVSTLLDLSPPTALVLDSGWHRTRKLPWRKSRWALRSW